MQTIFLMKSFKDLSAGHFTLCVVCSHNATLNISEFFLKEAIDYLLPFCDV
jgi:hypothetical protein